MIFNFFQGVFAYSVYLTLRQREMVVYIILLLGQIAQCLTVIFKDKVQPLGAFQQGGYIGNTVACCILLYLSAKALWSFHSTGGLHGDQKNNK